jgi:hypothetical protein
MVFVNFQKQNTFLKIHNLFKPNATISLKKKDITRILKLQKQLIILSTSFGINLVTENVNVGGGVLISKITFYAN